VAHRPSPAPGTRYFGPYLGGLQVRRAVSGLTRVLPLSYAAGPADPGPDGQPSGTEPSGTSAELARAFGVSAVSRGSLARTVAAVLDRDPAAVASVRAGLAARRDAAAAALAFEFAARLQRELQALAWVTAEQKVTTAASDDVDVCGWADGVLVCFAVRGGRLSGWTQGACDADAARSRLAATPAPWAGFARRNAELAARLAAGQPVSAADSPGRTDRR
jgi:excinuclease ABC subunit C